MKEDLSTIITFKVNDANFAFDALKVRHILELVKLTLIPNTPNFIAGVFNLHGTIVPVADLRALLGVEVKNNTQDTSIIVISPNGLTDSYLGLIVDMVLEVDAINAANITPSIIEGSIGLVNTFIGTIIINKEFVNIIDLDGLISIVEEAKY